MNVLVTIILVMVALVLYLTLKDRVRVAQMQYAAAVIIGVLAAIGAMTLIAIMYVMRFGDEAFNGLVNK